MPENHTPSRRSAFAVLLILLLACVGLAACGGGSSKSSSSTSATNAAAGTRAPGAPGSRGAFAGRFAAVRECLQKNGVTLPSRPPGGGAPHRGGPGGLLGGAGTSGGFKLPKGMTRAQYQAVIKKCGGFGRGGFAGGGDARFSSPTAKKALAKFAACLRTNGVNVPEPNTSGKGPIFSTKGLDTKSAKFAAAESKCRTDLLGAFGARPGARGTSPSS